MRISTKAFKIGAYVRVSTEEQAENPEGSIKNQEQRLRDYVKFRNADGNKFGEVVEVFSDPGISAKDVKRPSLQRLLNKIRAKEIDLVLVTDLSRFTRLTKDFSILWDFMHENNRKFQSLRENFDSTTAAGEIIMFILASISQLERDLIADRVKIGLANARAKGKLIGRKKMRNSQMIRALRAKGLTYRAIAELCSCSHGVYELLPCQGWRGPL